MSHSPPTPTAVETHIVVTDAEFVIRFVSTGFCEALACGSGDLIGVPLAHWLDDCQDGDQLGAMTRELDDHRSFTLALSLRARSGESLEFDFRLVPVSDVAGESTIYLAVGCRNPVRDFADRDAAERFATAYGGSSLTFEKGQAYFRELEKLMNTERLYRDPKVTIATVARRLGTNTQYLSQVVNYFAGTRFSTYVNNRRLESMAVRLAAGERLPSDTAWSEAGFGSYSAFYRALKRHYGVSPATFFHHG